MLLSDFDYDLPPHLVARYPTSRRRASRLLAVGESLSDAAFTHFPDFLRSGDLLVFNDTRVIRARLHGNKESGGRVEILIERIHSDRDALAQVKASKTPREGSNLLIGDACVVTVVGRQTDMFLLHFSMPIEDCLAMHGEIPLPPYLNRGEETADAERYQTVYAQSPGAVAAPTAGLHFDLEMLAETRAMGVGHAFVTLHVGAGTFQSLRHEEVSSNHLHNEFIVVSEDVCAAIRQTRAAGGRVIAVGTTVVRALETAAENGEIEAYRGDTDIFIWPGYAFCAVDCLLTNFHLPKSSLLMLVAAFGGYERMLAAYQHAVGQQYRFFSYGDAMLIESPGS